MCVVVDIYSRRALTVVVEGEWATIKKGGNAMTIQISLAIVVSIISLCFSAYFGLRNNKRSDTKDLEERVKSDTRINMKLDNISVAVADVKKEVASMREDIASHNGRLIKLEASAKSAHRRIDFMEKCSGIDTRERSREE